MKQPSVLHNHAPFAYLLKKKIKVQESSFSRIFFLYRRSTRGVYLDWQQCSFVVGQEPFIKSFQCRFYFLNKHYKVFIILYLRRGVYTRFNARRRPSTHDLVKSNVITFMTMTFFFIISTLLTWSSLKSKIASNKYAHQWDFLIFTVLVLTDIEP